MVIQKIIEALKKTGNTVRVYRHDKTSADLSVIVGKLVFIWSLTIRDQGVLIDIDTSRSIFRREIPLRPGRVTSRIGGATWHLVIGIEATSDDEFVEIMKVLLKMAHDFATLP